MSYRHYLKLALTINEKSLGCTTRHVARTARIKMGFLFVGAQRSCDSNHCNRISFKICSWPVRNWYRHKDVTNFYICSERKFSSVLKYEDTRGHFMGERHWPTYAVRSFALDLFQQNIILSWKEWGGLSAKVALLHLTWTKMLFPLLLHFVTCCFQGQSSNVKTELQK